MQAGWEQGITNVIAGLSGLNMVYESVGMHASLLGFCHESLIMGDDILGQVMRCIRGIDVSEDAVSVEAMRATCIDGPGHYLGSEQTLALMQTEYLYPRIADRTSPKEWEEGGKPDLLATAGARKKQILETAQSQISDDLDAEIRTRWPIYFQA